jgi:hypothetical protein
VKHQPGCQSSLEMTVKIETAKNRAGYSAPRSGQCWWPRVVIEMRDYQWTSQAISSAQHGEIWLSGRRRNRRAN